MHLVICAKFAWLVRVYCTYPQDACTLYNQVCQTNLPTLIFILICVSTIQFVKEANLNELISSLPTLTLVYIFAENLQKEC